MLGKTHKLGGICTGLMISSSYLNGNFSAENLTMAGAFTAGCLLGSLLPDIDHRGSTISNKNQVTKGASWVISLFGHRGITHAPLVYLIFLFIIQLLFHSMSNPISLYLWLIGTGIAMGAFSHLILDFLTKGGIPLFFPFISKKFHLLPLKTGKCDPFIQVLLIIVTIFVCLSITIL